MFFRIVVLKNFSVFTGKHQCWSLFLIKLQTWRLAKRLQNKCFPVNIAKFLRTPFLQNTSGGCFYKMMKFYKDMSTFFLTGWRHMSRKNTMEISSIYWSVLLLILFNWLFYPALAGWSDCMGKVRPDKAGSRLYKRGIPSCRDEKFYM